MSERLAGKTALVVGAGRGIGRAVALAFAGESARLVLAARTRSQLETVRDECVALGALVHVEAGDISKLEDANRIVGAAPIDVLVNAAGVYGPIGRTWEVDPEEWAEAIAVNLFGSFLVCRAAAASMVGRGSGKIVLLGGGGATGPLPHFSAYAASKAGVARLAETLAEESAPHVQVNVIAPGLVDTSLQDDVLAAGEKAGPLLEKIRAARETGAGAVPPEVAAELAVFLASAESGTLTGKIISAPHDPWREWGANADDLNATALYTIRRLDPFTIRPLVEALR
jgi:NAD(P)-dependent dehydrogenase (short-subunit alcohol dehydrogenase family)